MLEHSATTTLSLVVLLLSLVTPQRISSRSQTTLTFAHQQPLQPVVLLASSVFPALVSDLDLQTAMATTTSTLSARMLSLTTSMLLMLEEMLTSLIVTTSMCKFTPILDNNHIYSNSAVLVAHQLSPQDLPVFSVLVEAELEPSLDPESKIIPSFPFFLHIN